MDGVTIVCYADKRSVDVTGIASRGNFGIAPEDMGSCFAYYHANPCASDFKLRKGEELETVACDDMMQAVKQKNLECDDCLEEIVKGCC